jgi:hypothetical protein
MRHAVQVQSSFRTAQGRSSIWQSTGLQNRGLQVRVLSPLYLRPSRLPRREGKEVFTRISRFPTVSAGRVRLENRMDVEGGPEASFERSDPMAGRRRSVTPALARAAFSLAIPLMLVVTIASTGVAGVTSPSAPAASRMIDRAFVCTNAFSQTGGREIRVGATTGFREDGGWKWLATAGIANEGMRPTRLGEDGPTVYTHWGFGFSAGAGALAIDPTLPRPERFFYIWAKWSSACKPVPTRRVPLSARGLVGGVADDDADPDEEPDQFECAAPQKLFVRVRGVFRRATSLRLDRAFMHLTTAAPVREAAFAARTASGRPYAFASVSESGIARIFTAANCLD